MILYISFALGVFIGILIGDKKARIKFFCFIGNLLKKSTLPKTEDTTDNRSRFDK